jgi:hypothetical protein
MSRVEVRLRGVSDVPSGRLALRGAFYSRHGGALARLGRAELDFIQWEIERGLLNPLAGDPPGSAYWRSAQEAVARDAEVASEALAAGISLAGAPEGVVAWAAAIRAPDAARWYAAHNRSLVLGMRAVASAARTESVAEQRFINLALRRVLAAELLVVGAVRRPFRPFARAAADPRVGTVRALTRARWLYPRRYPLPSGWMDHPAQRAWGSAERALAYLLLDPAAARPITDAHLQALFGPVSADELQYPDHVPSIPDEPRSS